MQKQSNNKSNNGTSLKDRDEAYKKTYKATRSHRAAVRAYASGNRWAEENARAVGNW